MTRVEKPCLSDAQFNLPYQFEGITSYGVSMTTLEEVFLSLEGENAEETEAVEGVSSVKLVRARALSRSLSLQSKTLSYQVGNIFNAYKYIQYNDKI